MRHQEHKKKENKTIDLLIYPLGLLGPLLTIPQVWKVWTQKNVAGLSLFTWAGYIIAALAWISYGIHKRDKPIILLNALWLVIDSLIVAAILLYS